MHANLGWSGPVVCPETWNAGPRASGFDLTEGPEQPLIAQVIAALAADPERLAIDDGRQALSRAQVSARIGALAAAIEAATPPGSPVGVRLPDGADAPIAWLACLAAGRPAVLLDPLDGEARFNDIATISRLSAVIAAEPVAGWPTLAPIGHAAAHLAIRETSVDRPAFIVWTSGSTGRPKGIVHSQRSVVFRAGLLVASGRLGPDDGYLSLNSIASMGALLNAVAALLSGACLHRVDLSHEGLIGVLERVRHRGVTAVIGVPALYRMLCRLDGAAEALGRLRLVSSNGEALMAADLDLLRQVLAPACKVQMVYGATETQAGMRFVPNAEGASTVQVAAGRPIPGVQWAVLGEDGGQVAPGETGELWIRSRYTAIGEWENGVCVTGRLTPDPEPGFRRYAMGDLVRVGRDGLLTVVGRRDRQLKRDGYRVEPVEIEAALRDLDGVLDSAVLPVTRGDSVHLVAFVAAGPACPPGMAERLSRALAARLAPAMRPQRLHILDALPLLAGNKIDAAALVRLDEERRRR